MKEAMLLNDENYLSPNRLMSLLGSICFMFGTNICFLLAALPLTLYIILFKTIDLRILSLLWIFCGPAVTALFLAINKLLDKQDTGVLKTFFTSYLENFKQSILISGVQGLLLFVLYLDMKFFMAKKMFILYYMFMIISILVILISFYIYPLLSKFKISSINLIKLSILYSVKKFHILIISLILFLLTTYISTQTPTIYIFFGPCITCYFILMTEKKAFLEIKQVFFK